MVKSIIGDYFGNSANNLSTVTKGKKNQAKELKDDQYMCNDNYLKMGEW